MQLYKLTALAVLGAALSGCANLMSIHHDDTLLYPGDHVLAVDAKQRAIISTRVKVGTQVSRRYCSEPSPDALTAMSLGASGDLGVAGLKSKDPEVRLRAAISASEAASTIERTQTINMLREEMFRTCERYLNGAINADEFMIQAARDQRLMVSILAIEQLTGAVKPPATVLISGSSTSNYTSPDLLPTLIDKAKADIASANGRIESADKTVSAKLKAVTDVTNCTDVPAAEADPVDCKSAKGELVAARKSLTDAQEAKKTAEADLAKWQAAAEKAITGIASTAGVNADYNAGGQTYGLNPLVAATVSKSVENIVKAAYDFNEVEATCIVRLRNLGTTPLPKDPQERINFIALENRCMQLFNSHVDLQTVLTIDKTEEYKQAIAKLDADLAANEKILVDYLGTDQAAPEKWKALGAKLKWQGWPEVHNIAEAVSVFRNTGPDVQAAIAGATK